MQLSLKEARRIERRIENIINEPLQLTSEINIYEDDGVALVVEDARAGTVKAVSDLIALIDARAFIRRSIQEVNEQANINNLISERERLLRANTIWTMVTNSDYYRQSVPALAKMVEELQNSTQSAMAANYGRNDTVLFNTVSEDLVNKAIQSKYESQLIIDNIDDKLASLNAKTIIEISNELVTFLREKNVI